MTALPTQTLTYLHDNLPSKDKLLSEFKGKPLDALRTPAMVIDRAVFANNCAKMHESAKAWNADFRAHVKTHKTVEGTRLQLVSAADRTSAVVVSTLMEGWEIIRGGLVTDGTVKDILYGLPVATNKLSDLAKMSDELTAHGGVVRLLIDNTEQVAALKTFNLENNRQTAWSVFVKVEVGARRAGLSPDSPEFQALLLGLFAAPAVSVHGFYCHASQSYASTSLPQASSFLSLEVKTVNDAAKLAQKLLLASNSTSKHTQPFVISVGATPTAHAFAEPTGEVLAQLKSELCGKLELHAGNYPVLDLQQMHTNLVGEDRVSHRILATVVSYYSGRGKDGGDEAMCDAGAIAMSKDTGPSGGFGDVVGCKWKLGRVSQEHGVLVQSEPKGEKLKIGSVVQLISQHVCLTAANHPWYYVVDSEAGDGGDKVVDVWVAWKGW
ncbi:putative serine dehydratase domain-containing protein [Hysterangium stoloniferum]|nr:putative serine dehydratase domain-containing protein [Hysterangium stoloniferum]